MNKKLLLGSLLVLTSLLLMPTIPAIQQKTLDIVDFKEIKDVKDLDGGIKFPILYFILARWILYRYLRGLLLRVISSSYDVFRQVTTIHYPIIYARSVWLFFNIQYSAKFFQYISDKYGLGWDLEWIKDLWGMGYV